VVEKIDLLRIDIAATLSDLEQRRPGNGRQVTAAGPERTRAEVSKHRRRRARNRGLPWWGWLLVVVFVLLVLWLWLSLQTLD
jgi:type VI protein secretion system component VasF